MQHRPPCSPGPGRPQSRPRSSGHRPPPRWYQHPPWPGGRWPASGAPFPLRGTWPL